MLPVFHTEPIRFTHEGEMTVPVFPSLFVNTELYQWVILPLLIFIARILDVSLGTIRVIFISRGVKNIASFISFFEVLIWLMAIGQIMQHIQNAMCYFGYAAGYTTGTYAGLVIEKRLFLGLNMIRIITKKPATELIEALKNAHYGITSVQAEGTDGIVHIIFTIIKRNNLSEIKTMIKAFNPHAFYTIEDIRTINGGNFPQPELSSLQPWQRILSSVRKGK